MKKISTKVYFYSTLICTAILSTIYSLSFIVSFDTPIAYFSANSILPHIAKYLFLCTIIWILSIFISIPKNSLIKTQCTASFMSKFSSVFVAISLLAYAVTKILATSASKLSIIEIIMAILSAAYFAGNIITSWKNNFRVTLGISVILWATASMAEAYINRFVTMNNPIKILLMLSMMSIMFFALYEIKCLTCSSAPRAYVASTLANICISVTFAVSFLIIYVSGIYAIKEFMPHAIISLTIAFYNICKLSDFLSAQEKAPTNEQ